MRKAGQQFLRQPSQSSSLLDPSAQCRVRKPAQAEQRIGDGPKGGEARVEAVGRILEDHLDLRPKRRAGTAEISSSSSWIVPSVGSIKRARSRARVDLPQPDSPTSPTVSPCPIAKLTP